MMLSFTVKITVHYIYIFAIPILGGDNGYVIACFIDNSPMSVDFEATPILVQYVCITSSWSNTVVFEEKAKRLDSHGSWWDMVLPCGTQSE
jgi:hypothetical protein